MVAFDSLTPSERRQISAGRATTSARGASPSLREKRASPNGTPTRQGDAPREQTPISAGGGNPRGPLPRKGEGPKGEKPPGMLTPAEPIWGCHTCPEVFTTLASAERHTGPGHRRLEWLPGRKDQQA